MHEVCFTGDIFRVELDQLLSDEGMATRNVVWLKHLFDWQIRRATGLSTTTCLVKRFGQDVSIGNLYELLRAPFCLHSWARFFHSPNVPEPILRYMEERFANRLVIGMELSPFMIAALETLNVPYLDFTHSPIRYLNEYYLSVRTNRTAVREAISHYGLGAEELYLGASVRKAAGYRKIRTKLLDPHSAVFCGQMPVDSSLISRDGSPTEDGRILEAVTTLTEGYNTVYYKRHPHLQDGAPILKKLQSIRRVKLLDYAFYDVMGRDEILAVGALSSGTLKEAHFFGKTSHRFLDAPDYQSVPGLASDPSVPPHLKYSIVNSQVFHPMFWHDALLPVMPVDETAKDCALVCEGKNFIQQSLNMRWG